jgi:D-alanyl-D-alanine carboxypeptidase (penicillin-binding protein 5/6)
VTSSQRDGMRLVSVVMGSGSMKAREMASAALLNYGFTFYETKLLVKGGTALTNAKVWKAQFTPTDIGIMDDIWLTLPRGKADSVKTTLDVRRRLIAPLALGDEVGTLQLKAGDETVATRPLHPLKADPAGGWWRRLVDTIRLWFA